MKLPPLYLITDRRQTKGRPLIEVIKAALDGGARLVQLREKGLTGKELYGLAEEVRELTHRYGTKLLINDRIDIALATGADGVHLPSDSFRPNEARRLLGEGKIIGISTHSLDEAASAEEEGADFVTFSPIYYTPSKAEYGKPQGVEKLRALCESVNIPVYALGGIKSANIEEVKEAGAYGAAMISAIISAENVTKTTKNIINRLAG